MSDVLDLAFLHVDRLPENCDLVAALQSFGEVVRPCAWVLARGSEDLRDPANVSLTFGISANSGALTWHSHTSAMVPAHGTNNGWVRYHLAGIHDTYLAPGSEVPRETVYRVLTEFLATRALPTCISWVAAPDELAD